MQKRNAGVSLVEMWLVIIIGMGIMYYGFRQYLAYRFEADIYQVQYNVDVIFQAMGQYFRANCAKQTGPFRTNNKTVSISLNDLTTGGYLTTKLALSPLLDYTSASKGYLVQFNQVLPSPTRKIDLSDVNGSKPTPATVDVGKIILWKAQVGVLLKNPDTARAISSALLAECLSSQSGTTVSPCKDSAGTGTIAVFERLPSFALSTANSDLWLSNPLVKQFTQMYTVDPLLVLTDGTLTNTQYYVCTN